MALKCCHPYRSASESRNAMATAKLRISRWRAGSFAFTRRELSMRLVNSASGVGPRRPPRCPASRRALCSAIHSVPRAVLPDSIGAAIACVAIVLLPQRPLSTIYCPFLVFTAFSPYSLVFFCLSFQRPGQGRCLQEGGCCVVVVRVTFAFGTVGRPP